MITFSHHYGSHGFRGTLSLQQLTFFATSAALIIGVIVAIDNINQISAKPAKLIKEINEIDAEINRFVRHRRLQHIVNTTNRYGVETDIELDDLPADPSNFLEKHSSNIENFLINGSSMVIGRIGQRVHNIGKKLEQYNLTNAGSVFKATGGHLGSIAKDLEHAAVMTTHDPDSRVERQRQEQLSAGSQLL